MYAANILDHLRTNDLGMITAGTPSRFLPPEYTHVPIDKKPTVTETQIQSLRQIIKACVVTHFCGNVVGLRKKSEINKSLFAGRTEINIVEAMKAVSAIAEAMVTDVMRTSLPPTQFKEVTLLCIASIV